MNPFDVLLVVLGLLTVGFFIGVVRWAFSAPQPNANRIGQIASMVAFLAFTLPATCGLGYWTAAAIHAPAPTEVTWENISQNPDATWFQRQAAWVVLRTGWVTPEVTEGFFYSTARFYADGGQVTLVGLPGVQQWFRLDGAAPARPVSAADL